MRDLSNCGERLTESDWEDFAKRIGKKWIYGLVLTSKRIPQARGHQRSSSDTQAFRERTKRDARDELQRELEKLEVTARENKKTTVGRQFAGFQHLFERFLQEEGPSLEWDHIQKLPEDAVSETHGRAETGRGRYLALLSFFPWKKSKWHPE